MAELRTALVTGASRGIGRAIAERLGRDGVLVGVHYGHSRAAAEETVRAIEAQGGSAFPVEAPLGVDGDVEALFMRLEDVLAGRPLDILVNNASTPPGVPIETTSPEGFDQMFAVNVKAPFFILRRAIPLLRDGGRVITVSSASTRIAAPAQLAYVMSKAAVEVMALTLSTDLGRRGITVNAVTPGATDTDMNRELLATPGVADLLAQHTALGRIGRPADIADAVGFLASEDARWITGQVIDVSGGVWLGPPVVERA